MVLKAHIVLFSTLFSDRFYYYGFQRDYESAYFEASLDDVFRRSENLWRKKRPLDERNVELHVC